MAVAPGQTKNGTAVPTEVGNVPSRRAHQTRSQTGWPASAVDVQEPCMRVCRWRHNEARLVGTSCSQGQLGRPALRSWQRMSYKDGGGRGETKAAVRWPLASRDRQGAVLDGSGSGPADDLADFNQACAVDDGIRHIRRWTAWAVHKIDDRAVDGVERVGNVLIHLRGRRWLGHLQKRQSLVAARLKIPQLSKS